MIGVDPAALSSSGDLGLAHGGLQPGGGLGLLLGLVSEYLVEGTSTRKTEVGATLADVECRRVIGWGAARFHESRKRLK